MKTYHPESVRITMNIDGEEHVLNQAVSSFTCSVELTHRGREIIEEMLADGTGAALCGVGIGDDDEDLPLDSDELGDEDDYI